MRLMKYSSPSCHSSRSRSVHYIEGARGCGLAGVAGSERGAEAFGGERGWKGREARASRGRARGASSSSAASATIPQRGAERARRPTGRRRVFRSATYILPCPSNAPSPRDLLKLGARLGPRHGRQTERSSALPFKTSRKLLADLSIIGRMRSPREPLVAQSSGGWPKFNSSTSTFRCNFFWYELTTLQSF